jgi:hypothetical protein
MGGDDGEMLQYKGKGLLGRVPKGVELGRATMGACCPAKQRLCGHTSLQRVHLDAVGA